MSSTFTSTSIFSPSDWPSLSSATGVHAETLARRLTTKHLTDFKLPELKEILKWLKARPNWQNNQYVHGKQAAYSGSKSKAQLLEQLKAALQTQQQIVNGVDPAIANANPTGAPATAPASTTSTSSTNMNNMSYQQQQQAQYAAQRYQPTDYRGYPANAARPNNQMQPGFHPNPLYTQQQAQQQYQQQAAQQLAYTNGSRPQQYGQNYGTPQYPQQQQQRGYPQQPQQSQNGYSSYPSSTTSTTSNLTHPALQTQTLASKQNEISALTSHPNMHRHRSPYEQEVQRLAMNLLNATSHTANQSTGAAGGSYHTTLTFNIAPNMISRIKRANRPVPPGQESQMLEVHLRLFSAIEMDHTPWEKKFRVLVNGHEVAIPEPKKLSKTKKKGLELVKGLDISEFVQSSNTVEVSVYRQSYTVELFRGLVYADLIRIRDTSELMDQFRKTIKDEESKMQAAALERSCVICHSKKDPLRCSRCKNEWYCGSGHQREHWQTHREHCHLPTPQQDAERESMEKKAAQLAMLGKNGRTRLIMPVKTKHEEGDELEDGVEEVDALVSLKCPLSLERYEYPARGRNCGHLPCFNLETYLMFSQQSGVWQCFEEDTRVLTNHGFKFLDEIEALLKRGEEVLYAGYDKETKQLTYVRGALVYPENTTKKLISFTTPNEDKRWSNSSQSSPHTSNHASIRVTPNHNMFLHIGDVNTIHSDEIDYATVKASEVLCQANKAIKFISVVEGGMATTDKGAQLLLNELAGLGLDTVSKLDAFLELYGLWLSNGTLESQCSQSIRFHPTNSMDIQWLRERLSILELDSYETLSMLGCQIISVHNTNWFDYFNQQYGDTSTSSSLILWSWVLKQLNKQQCRLIVDGLTLTTSTSQPYLVTSDVHFRDQLLVLFYHAGYSAYFESDCQVADSWRVYFDSPDSTDAQQACWPTMAISDSVKEEVYEGRVWCVTIDHPDHLVLAQRCASASVNGQRLVTQSSRPIIIGQCPVCYKGLPWEEIEVNLQMAAILRETNSEIAQIRVHPTGEYDPIASIPDGESGDGREPGSRKRKAPASSPTPSTPNAATAAQQPPSKVQAVGATADFSNSSAAAAAAGTSSTTPSNAGPTDAYPPPPYPSSNVPASSPLMLPPRDTPSPGLSHLLAQGGPGPSPSPTTINAAGTADEPIELD